MDMEPWMAMPELDPFPENKPNDLMLDMQDILA